MNYQEHKAFFDGRHSKKNNYRNYKDRTRVTMDGDNVVLTYGASERSTYFDCKIVVRPDNHFYIHMPQWNQGGVMKIGKLTGVNLSSYKQETIKESRRIWLKGSHWTSDGVSVPWVDGALYYGTQPAELDKHVDFKRSFDPEKRLEIQRKIRDLSKAARVLAVMDAYDMDRRVMYLGRDYAYENEILMLERDGVTGALAEAVCASAVKLAKQDWYYDKPVTKTTYGPGYTVTGQEVILASDSSKKKKRLSAVKNAMEKFTKALYGQAGAYVWTEVTP